MIALSDDEVVLPSGLRLALRRAPGTRRPALLVHDVASNARVWDGVARRLAAGGHEVVAVDLRGHGRSDTPPTGYDTATAAADLAEVITALGLVGDRAPLVAGQGWGGDVVLEVAARHGAVAAVALVDGGWLRLGDRFTAPEHCWAALTPHPVGDVPAVELEQKVRRDLAGWPSEAVDGALASLRLGPDGHYTARLAREHHRSIEMSRWEGDPRALYPRVGIPALLLAAVPRPGEQAGTGLDAVVPTRVAAREALAGLGDAQVRWYVGAHHDLHAQLPEAVAADLLALLRRVDPS